MAGAWQQIKAGALVTKRKIDMNPKPQQAGSMCSSILVVGPSWIGDMVMAQSLFMTLVRERPGVQIDVLAPDWCLAVIARMPQVRHAIRLPFGHGEAALAARYRFGRELAGRKYDEAIVLPNSWKSGLVPFAARIGRRTGWRGEMRYGLLNDLRHLDKRRLPLMIDRFNALAFPASAVGGAEDFPAPHPYPALRADKASARAAMARFGIVPDRKVLALCPGAEYGPAKQWPADKHVQLARAWLDRGWQILLLGSAQDGAIAGEIRAGLGGDAQPDCHDLTGRTSLDEAMDMLSVADAVVANDSGLMHLAAAFGRPLVAIYGSTTPDHSPPLSNNARIVRLGLECSPCFKRQCPLGHTNCLNELPAGMVLDSMRSLDP